MNAAEYRLAEAAVSRAENVLKEFDCTAPGTPLHWLLGRAKRHASDALVALIDADAENPAEIRRLQNEARRYGDLVEFLRETIADAEDAHHLLEEEDRQEILGEMQEAAESAQ